MKNLKSRYFLYFLSVFLMFSGLTLKAEGELEGNYKGIFYHDGSKFYNFGKLVVRRLLVGATQKFAANLKVYFGGWTSNEFLIYDFDFEQCRFILVGSILSCKSDKSDVSFEGTFDPDKGGFGGIWFSKLMGPIGKFESSRLEEPKPPADAIHVKALSGYFRGELVNKNPEIKLPKRVSLTVVTTQDISGTEPKIMINGSVRLYRGAFGSLDYYEVRFKEAQFNFYNRFLTFATEPSDDIPVMTFRGDMNNDGIFTGSIIVDGFGEAATVDLKPYP